MKERSSSKILALAEVVLVFVILKTLVRVYYATCILTVQASQGSRQGHGMIGLGGRSWRACATEERELPLRFRVASLTCSTGPARSSS